MGTARELSQQGMNMDCHLGVRNNKEDSIIQLVITCASSTGYENQCLQGVIIVV